MPKTPYEKTNPESIQSMFDSIAQRYDLGNAVLSFGMHWLWNRCLTKNVLPDSSDKVILDLCSGTGDIAYDHLKRCQNSMKAHLLDFSEGMLDQAKEKAKTPNLQRHHLNFIVGDAQKIPLADHSVDAITIAYGIRNVEDPLKCIRESSRVLKNGGSLGILELTRPNNRLLKALHQVYLRTLLPILGRFVTQNHDAYQYLSRSIYHFVSPEELAEHYASCGLKNVRVKPLMGGIATLITGDKVA